ncbi:MAG: CHASE2 domain-containing protein [Solirubrobacteraceae bacterium]
MAERVRSTRFSGRLKLLAAVAALAAGAAIGLHAAGAFMSLELKTIDARFHIRGTDKPRQPIVVVGIDPRTIEDLNVRPPLPRALHAQVINRLHRDGARLIAYDISFLNQSDPKDDSALVHAVSAARPVLLATQETDDGRADPVPAGHKPSSVGAVTASVGVPTDSDGVVRQMFYAPVFLKTLPVRAAELVTGKPVSESHFPNNVAWVDYAGPPATFRNVAFSDVLAGRVPASTFRGKIVLVGNTAPVLHDIAQTPVSSTPMAGTEIQANALETVLDGFPLQSAPGWLNVLIIIVLSVLPAALAVRLPSLYVLGASLVAAVLFLVGAQLAFNSGTIVATVDPLFGLLLGTGGVIAVDSWVERRQRHRLEEALGRLLPKPTAFFISYRRDDTRWPANSLRAALAERFGPASVFMDTHTISPGQEWPSSIEQAIRGCTVVLVLIGARWLELDESGRRRIDDPGDWVRREVEAGLRRTDVATVPVLVEGTIMPHDSVLPEPLKPLSRRHAISLSAERYGAELDEFVDAIELGLIQDYVARQGAPPPDEEDAVAAADGDGARPEPAPAPNEPAEPEPAPPAATAQAEPPPAPPAASTPAETQLRLSPQLPHWRLVGARSRPKPAEPEGSRDAEAARTDPLNTTRSD